ncbi:MAG: hypothetical protein JO362_15850 [Streptomycetaceae bacterium]|nr:hypothetical protein [Streptomycetaceae bacterium]
MSPIPTCGTSTPGATAFPTQYLWGPGPREEAVAWLSEHQPESDLCGYLDQVVLVRVHDDTVALPVYPAVATGLPATEQRGSWYALRVDRGLDALNHARALTGAAAGHASAGECRKCPFSELSEERWASPALLTLPHYLAQVPTRGSADKVLAHETMHLRVPSYGHKREAFACAQVILDLVGSMAA